MLFLTEVRVWLRVITRLSPFLAGILMRYYGTGNTNKLTKALWRSERLDYASIASIVPDALKEYRARAETKVHFRNIHPPQPMQQ